MKKAMDRRTPEGANFLTEAGQGNLLSKGDEV